LLYNLEKMILFDINLLRQITNFQNGLNNEKKRFMLHIKNITNWESKIPYFDILSYYQRSDIMKWLYINIKGKFTIDEMYLSFYLQLL
jgi:hypothetical protein